MKDFWNEKVYRRARRLNGWVDQLVSMHPALSRLELSQPMRRASIAIAASIAEGWGAYANDGGRWCFNAALGSLAALDCLVFLAFERDVIPDTRAREFIARKVDIEKRLQAMLGKEEFEEPIPAKLTLVQ